MPKVVVYWGCFAPTKQYALELSTRNVFEALNIEILELENSACCGYPYRGVKPKLWTFLAARIMALAEKQGFDEILPVCNGCYNSLIKTKFYLERDKKLLEEINSLLKEENLEYRGKVKPIHVIEYFHDYFDVKALKEKLFSEDRKDIKIAAHYGCDAIRPGEVPRFDSSRNPQKFENIIEALGFTAVRDYPRKLDCCGAPLMAINPELGLRVSGLKLKNAKLAGADLLVTTCEYCFEMLDSKQDSVSRLINEKLEVPVMYYQQLLGLVLGISEKELGLNFNMSPIDVFLEKFKR
ncbi:MAG: hypothetical protein DRJ39_04055 [Thermoprotei archaeon]|nr:CoB--CoM heterodisulfide reductase iron-sulfur subunit B family protein [Thermoproteales archaeon]RLE83918.1 MAG: hypothetical protein DRJ39_04055 [Thermoprotei archaeon]